jgi:hypothetical protein
MEEPLDPMLGKFYSLQFTTYNCPNNIPSHRINFDEAIAVAILQLEYNYEEDTIMLMSNVS